MNAEHQIGVTPTTLGGALRNAPLRVPMYQREYSWTHQRVRKLFDDIHKAMVKRQTTYFLGTVVVTPGEPPSVVDGQQRLATTCIFLAAVRDALFALRRDKEATSVENDFLLMYDRHAQENIPRLTMNIDDREYMQDRVLTHELERKAVLPTRFLSHERINEAAAIAARRVQTIMEGSDTTPGKVDALNEWIDFIDKRAMIVVLMPPSRFLHHPKRRLVHIGARPLPACPAPD